VIASALQMEVDDLFPVAETLQLLRLAEIEGGDIRLTDTGKQFAEAGVDDRKKLFQRQLMDHVPLANHIRACCRSAPTTWRPSAASSTSSRTT